MWKIVPWVACSVVLVACGDDSSATTGAGGGGGTSSSTTGTPSATTSTSTSGAGGDATSGSTGSAGGQGQGGAGGGGGSGAGGSGAGGSGAGGSGAGGSGAGGGPDEIACGGETCTGGDVCIVTYFGAECSTLPEGETCPDGTTETQCGGDGHPCCCAEPPPPRFECVAPTGCAGEEAASCACLEAPCDEGYECNDDASPGTFDCIPPAVP